MLCNLMTARTLITLPEVTDRGLRIHAYDPGFIPTTGLARQSPMVIRSVVLPVFSLFARLMPGMNVAPDGGAALAGLGDGSIDNQRLYMALRNGKPTWPDPSPLARVL